MNPEILNKLTAFAGGEQSFEKGENVFCAGTTTSSLGIVKEGAVQIEQNDFWGNRTVMDKLSAGGFFGETYAITGETLLVDVVAVEKSRILFVDVQKILESGKPQERLELTSMLLKISASKNLNFSRKIMFTSPKSIRGRLTAFLSWYSNKNQSQEFTIPFDRQAFADFLNVERTAMSKELGKMTEEGLLETRKNWFRLKKLEV